MISVALLMALVVVMQFISGMIPPIGGFSFSLVLIPIVIGAAVFGPATGAFLGATFYAVWWLLEKVLLQVLLPVWFINWWQRKILMLECFCPLLYAL